MRIVHVIDSLIAGGKERQLCELAKGLAEMPGISVDVVVLSDVVHYDVLTERGIPVHTVRRRASGPGIADFLDVYRLLKSLKPDVVHSWNSMCSIYAAPAARLCGASFVNGFFRNAPPRLSLNMRLRTLLTLPLSDVAVANSRAGVAAFHLPPAKALHIYNGFDQHRVEAIPPPEDVRRSLGIATPHVVGMVGGFRPDKDYRSFLEMATALTRSRDDVTVLAVGAGDGLDAFQREFPAADFPRIRFLGRRSDVEAIASVFTVGVLASYSEGISNAIMEYMALAKPVVATDIPGNRELVEDGRSGFLVKADDAKALGARVVELLDDPALAARFGARGRERIRNDFSFAVMIEAYAALYRRLTERRAPKSGLIQQVRRTVGL